jgi:hypothetical protein
MSRDTAKFGYIGRLAAKGPIDECMGDHDVHHDFVSSVPEVPARL